MPEPFWALVRTVFGRMAWVAAMVVLAASSAGATPILERFGDPTSSNPLLIRSLPAGPMVAWSNPALLLDCRPGVQVGGGVLAQWFELRLQPRPTTADVSAAIYRARQRTETGTQRLVLRPLATEDLRRARGAVDPDGVDGVVSLGAVVPVLGGRIVFGFGALLTLSQFQGQQPFFSDEREQYFSNSLAFERYGDRHQAATLVFAAAAAPWPWLRLAAGVTMTNHSESSTTIWVPDAADQSRSDTLTEIRVNTAFVPHFAVVVRPVTPLRLLATVHLPYASVVEGTSELQLFNYPYPDGESAFEQDFGFQYLTLPLRVGFGTTWVADDAHAAEGDGVGYSLALQAVWAQWSQYADRLGARPPVPWNDTFTLTAGGELSVGRHTATAAIAWEPSPVPAQVGRTNYVDNDRVAVSLGWRVSWEVAAVRLEASVAVQLHRLIATTTHKDANAEQPVLDEFPDAVDAATNTPIPESSGLQTNNPGYPGYSSAAWLLASGVNLQLDW